MSVYHGIRKTENIGSIADMSAGGNVSFAPGQPIDLHRVVVVLTTASTVAAASVEVHRRPIAGTAANEEQLEAFLVPITAAGGVVHFEFGRPSESDASGNQSQTGGDANSNLRVGEPPTKHQINPGQDVILTFGSEPGAGACEVYLEYFEQPFAGERVEDAVLANSTNFS